MAFPALSAAGDLGLGDMLGQQTKDETEEERKKRLASAGTSNGNPFNFGMTGVASVDLMGINAPGR